LQKLANTHSLMKIARSPTRLGVPRHRNHVPMALALGVDQRIAANQLVRKMKIDMSACREGGQLTTIQRSEIIGMDAVRLILDPVNAQLKI
jgi:hypothetical protein